METVSESEIIESLSKEAETLKIRLEDERQKLNDVTCKFQFWLLLFQFLLIIVQSVIYQSLDITVSVVAEKLEPISCINVKPRRILKGHLAKVLCADWSPDRRHIVSSSQVIFFYILYLKINQFHYISYLIIFII